MTDTKTTEIQAVLADKKPASLSAEAAFSAAASAEPVSAAEAVPEKATAQPAPMAASTTAAKKPAATKAAPKKTVTKRKAAPKRTAKTSKKIVGKGTTKMTTAKTAAKKTVKKAAPKAAPTNKKALQGMAAKIQAQLEKLTATAQERAKEVADRAVEVSKDAVEFNRLNVSTLVETGKITAKGAQELGKTNVKYTRENFVEASNVLKSSLNVANPKDFVEIQADFVRSSLDRVMDQTSNNMDAVTKLAGKAYQPIADRVSNIRKDFKKAA